MPAYLIKARTGQTLWRALLSILVTVGLVGWLHLPAVIAIVVTIYFATIIANRYLQVFEAMERGNADDEADIRNFVVPRSQCL
ncbi:hypothetical protein RYX41_16785 [Lactiplantibacillus plantarum]|nr:hypothetical protein [Lactiplantibacillus plantarum]